MSVDLVTELYQRGLYDILETIIVNIGYAGTANMFLVCPSWRDLLVSMGSWARFTEVKVRSSPKLKHLCRLNGWDRFIPYLTDQKEDFNAKMCPFIFNALTDLSDKIRFKNEINANSEQDMLSDVLRERFFTGGMVTSMIVHNDLTICGMINGQIKIWDTEASDPIIRSKAIKVISAHHDSVVCLDGHQSTLASAARDSRYRLWDLDTGAPMREIKCLNRLVNQISLGADYVLCLYWFELDYMMLSREDTKVVMWTVNGWDNIEQSDEFIMADYSSRPVQLCDLHGQRVIFTDDQQHVSVLDVVDDHLQKTMTIDIGSKCIIGLKFYRNILVYRCVDKLIKFFDILNNKPLSGEIVDSFVYSAWAVNAFGLVIQASSRISVHLWEDFLFAEKSQRFDPLILFRDQMNTRKLVSIILLTPENIITLAEEAESFNVYKLPDLPPQNLDLEPESLC